MTPQLNVQSKLALAEQWLSLLYLKRHKADQNQSRLFEWLKCVFVSKLFYGVSRFFNKYRFAVQASKEGAMSICLKPLRMSGSCCSNEFHMDSARALDLFTILAPANVEIHISDAWNGAVSNYSPFIRQTRGDVCLVVKKKMKESLPLIREFHTKINKMICYIDDLPENASLPVMEMNYARFVDVKSIDQLSQLVKGQKIKCLTIRFKNGFDNNLVVDGELNSTAEILELSTNWDCHFVDFHPLISQIKTYFPNLKKFNLTSWIHGHAGDDGTGDSAFIVTAIINYAYAMKATKAICDDLNCEVTIDLVALINLSKTTFESDWMSKLKEIEEFQQAEFCVVNANEVMIVLDPENPWFHVNVSAEED